MAEMMSINVQGLKELEKKMIELGPKIAKKALKSALVAGAQVVKRQIMATAPVDKGNLRKATYIKKMPKPNPFVENVIVGIRNGRKTWKKKDGKFDKSGDAFYWRFLEFGTKFIKGTKFVQNSFEAKKLLAMDKIKQVLTKKISDVVKEK
jgi:HK97 gp10 family phage protein